MMPTTSEKGLSETGSGITLNGLFQWILPRLAVYVVVAVVAAILFSIGAAVYSYVIYHIYVPPGTACVPGHSIIPENSGPTIPPASGTPGGAGDSTAPMVSAAPPSGLGVTALLGKYIYGPDDKKVGYVKDIAVGSAGQVSGVVVSVNSSSKIFFWEPEQAITVPYSSVRWVSSHGSRSGSIAVADVDKGIISADVDDKIKTYTK
jgi:sporulation protein YlmC with PRC-barrel domain